LLQTPHRFRTKRQLWAYIGLALRIYTSGEYRFEGGQLKRSKKAVAIHGLNRNYNHDLKNIFKSAATWAANNSGPFQGFYEACLAAPKVLVHTVPVRANVTPRKAYTGTHIDFVLSELDPGAAFCEVALSTQDKEKVKAQAKKAVA
jgi:hypothetical protein